MRFTRRQAERLVGRRIRTLVEFWGVPKGTTGTVIRADSAGRAKVRGHVVEEFDVAIQWNLSAGGRQVIGAGEIGGYRFVTIRGGKPLADWFTKDEYERYLTEIG